VTGSFTVSSIINISINRPRTSDAECNHCPQLSLPNCDVGSNFHVGMRRIESGFFRFVCKSQFKSDLACWYNSISLKGISSD